jgi:type III pantothenate kinase
MNLIAFDIGNSDITIGIWTNQQWQHVWRLPSDVTKSASFYIDGLRNLFLENNLKTGVINASIVSSVVPELTERIKETSNHMFDATALMLGYDMYSKLPLKILNPKQIGSDLVANSLAAHQYFKQECLVVDFGTALTFTTLSHDGEILGVAIAPGLKTAIKALTQNTAQLFEVPLQVPISALGKNTTHAIQAGVLLGYESMVLGMIDRIKKEMNNAELNVMATGGLSSILPALENQFTLINRNLTLDGLRLAAEFAEL